MRLLAPNEDDSGGYSECEEWCPSLWRKETPSEPCGKCVLSLLREMERFVFQDDCLGESSPLRVVDPGVRKDTKFAASVRREPLQRPSASAVASW